MENNLLKFDYCGSIIPFIFNGNDYMINATEMVKSVCKTKAEYNAKNPSHWLRSKEAQEYIQALLDVRNLYIENLVVTEKGGSMGGVRGGTWMHRLVAIRYAQWLDPRFAVWVDMKIDEIISNGYAFRDAEIQRLESVIQSQEPQINFYNHVLQTSENLYSTEQLCKDMNLKISSRSLINSLISQGVAYRRQDGKWFLSSPFDNFNYMKTITILDKKTGKPRNVRRWTEKGRHWIWSIFTA